MRNCASVEQIKPEGKRLCDEDKGGTRIRQQCGGMNLRFSVLKSITAERTSRTMAAAMVLIISPSADELMMCLYKRLVLGYCAVVSVMHSLELVDIFALLALLSWHSKSTIFVLAKYA